jgi:Protein of unknown function (DUF998)
MARKFLLSCGILSSLFYIAINIFIPRLFEGYSQASQTVSELSAIDAPTRPLWVKLAMTYVLLFSAFGLGLLLSAGTDRNLRIAARLIAAYVIINFYWPPMHLRGEQPTLTDTLHIAWAMITLVLMMLIMFYGAKAEGKGFRIYTIITFILFIGFGFLIAKDSPGIPKNLPTPWLGVWERINIAAFMLWIMVFSGRLLGKERRRSEFNLAEI